MLIIKAPLRVSLFGGGTDLPHYCGQHGSTIVSFALNKYIHLVYNERPTGGYRVTYSEVEEIDNLGNVQHTLVRAASERYGHGPPCTLTIVGDVPKGTGLGSSSALSTALCKLYLGEIGDETLFREAYSLEQSVNPEVGVQDFLPAIHGGLKVYKIDKNLNVTIRNLPNVATEVINRYGLLLYTGESRDARQVLASWGMPKIDNPLGKIQAIAESVIQVPTSWLPEVLGATLNLTWEMKKQAGDVTNAGLDAQYRDAIDAGVLGGKLCGAGQGGCWFFVVSPEKRDGIIGALNLTEIPFQINGPPVAGIVV